MSDPAHIISLGAGVQSSTMALMAACGEIKPMPVAAVFADTQAEPSSVYHWLDWLEKQLPFPVHRKTAGSLTKRSLEVHKSKKTGNVYVSTMIPAYVAKHTGGVSLLGRKCTADYKVAVIIKAVRAISKIPRGCKTIKVHQWIGITTDEAHRMKASREPWIENKWPLIDLGMSRDDCLKWCSDHGFKQPPRSACVYCPFHSDAEWRRLRRDEPESWARAVKFEKDMQAAHALTTGSAKLNGIAYLHNSLVSLDKVKFKGTPEHHQLNLFGNECEGLCGV